MLVERGSSRLRIEGKALFFVTTALFFGQILLGFSSRSAGILTPCSVFNVMLNF